MKYILLFLALPVLVSCKSEKQRTKEKLRALREQYKQLDQQYKAVENKIGNYTISHLGKFDDTVHYNDSLYDEEMRLGDEMKAIQDSMKELKEDMKYY